MMLAALQGHCNSPISGHAVVTDGQLHLRAGVYSPDGRRAVEATTTGPVAQAASLGTAAAAQLLAQGARELIDQIPH
jgi:hydroxymethylbilane synthase